MRITLFALAVAVAGSWVIAGSPADADRVSIAKDGKGFVLAGKPFVPWGFNYDRDYRMRLIEEFWDDQWKTIEEDFAEMKQLGANVIRVHLQFAKFMDGPDKPNAANLARLEKLVRLAESTGLYLDLTGLACYRKTDLPAWFESAAEKDRWAMQARFWEAIAKTCADRPGVFCYDLINEPLVPTDPVKQYLHPHALGGFHYVQYVAIDRAGRERHDIARDWIREMTRAIRKHDARRPITVGIAIMDLGGPRPEEVTGFIPAKLAPEVDFVCVHLYPAAKKVDRAIETLTRCGSDKPLVIEEMFPLACSAKELGEFIGRSRTDRLAQGWIGFYWGQTPDELKASKNMGDVFTLEWLKLFQSMRPQP